MLARPLICLVTDRHRLAERLELPPNDPRTFEALAALVARAGAAGITLVQVREPDLSAAALAACVRRVIAGVEGTGTRIIVNDRLDVALACGAGGVHLKDCSMPVARVRGLAPAEFLVGESIHRPEAAGTSEADYVVFGTVFPTRSKPPGQPLAGIEGLRVAVQAARVPVMAIGGVGQSELAAVVATGADGVAGVDLFLPRRTGEPEFLQGITQLVREAFDTFGLLS
jgi:thiamine-phosphate pyrophosphorylase